MPERTVPIGEFPMALLEKIQSAITTYTVGFSKIVGSNESEDILLLGTGTLVKAGDHHAILTAQHVLKVLPTQGRLGLILSPELRRDTIDTKGIRPVDIARGLRDCDGPDLAVVLLSAPIASTIAARKSFYNLDRHKEKALINPPDRQYGVWCNTGFIDERTIEEPGRDGYLRVKGFFMMSGFGGPDNAPVERDGFDFISMPVTYGSNPDIPVSFEGMSGGGLWQIQLIDEPNEIRVGELLLSGVVFYQEALSNNRRNVICHFRNSVYQTAYEAIKDGRP